MALILPSLDILRTVHVKSVLSASRTNLPQAPVINIVCLCVLYLHLKDTSSAPSRPLRARLVKRETSQTHLALGLVEFPRARAAASKWLLKNFSKRTQS